MPSSLKLFSRAGHVSRKLQPSRGRWGVFVMPGQQESDQGLDPRGHRPEASHTGEQLDLQQPPVNKK